KSKLVILKWERADQLKMRIAERGLPIEDMRSVHIVAHTNIPSDHDFGRVSVIPHDPEAFARALYAELHRCDEEGAKLIVIESPPDDAAWRGITDRLSRASA